MHLFVDFPNNILKLTCDTNELTIARDILDLLLKMCSPKPKTLPPKTEVQQGLIRLLKQKAYKDSNYKWKYYPYK